MSKPSSHNRSDVTTSVTAEYWPPPLPLTSSLPTAAPFTLDLLPNSLRPLAIDVADRCHVPLDFPGVVITVALAGVVNRRAIIQPKARDTTWTVVPNLWGAIVAPPGSLKSPIIQAITKPLGDIEREWQHADAEALAKYARDIRAWEAAKAKRKGDEPKRPIERRLLINDATFEKLHVLMVDNPAGLFVIRDELTGWLAELDRAGREGERAFYLQAWNGDTGHNIERVSRGSICVPACCLSMFGGLQPERLRDYLSGRGGVALSEDGLMQRFQVIVWPDLAGDFQYIDRPPDAPALNRVEKLFRRLVKLEASKPLRLRFDPDSQVLFAAWFEELETRLRSNRSGGNVNGTDDALPPLLASHLGKYRSLLPSLALLFELADAAAQGRLDETRLVSYDNTVRALQMCEYLESHARRIYSCVRSRGQSAAEQLAERIRLGALGNEFTCREVVQKNWSNLDSTETVKAACDELVRLNWIRPEQRGPGVTGGRPSTRYRVNQLVFDGPGGSAF